MPAHFGVRDVGSADGQPVGVLPEIGWVVVHLLRCIVDQDSIGVVDRSSTEIGRAGRVEQVNYLHLIRRVYSRDQVAHEQWHTRNQPTNIREAQGQRLTAHQGFDSHLTAGRCVSDDLIVICELRDGSNTVVCASARKPLTVSGGGSVPQFCYVGPRHQMLK